MSSTRCGRGSSAKDASGARSARCRWRSRGKSRKDEDGRWRMADGDGDKSGFVLRRRARLAVWAWTSLQIVGAPGSFLTQLRLVLRRAAIAQRRVQTLTIVEYLDVRIDRRPGLRSGR